MISECRRCFCFHIVGRDPVKLQRAMGALRAQSVVPFGSHQANELRRAPRRENRCSLAIVSNDAQLCQAHFKVHGGRWVHRHRDHAEPCTGKKGDDDVEARRIRKQRSCAVLEAGVPRQIVGEVAGLS